MMRLIDADELMEHVGRDRLDSRELIAEMIRNAPTVADETLCKESEAYVTYLERQIARMKGEIKALVFAMRCNGVNGDEVIYENGW